MIYIFVFWLIGLLAAAVYYRVKDGRILNYGNRCTHVDFFTLLFLASLAYWVVVPTIAAIFFLIIHTWALKYFLISIGVVAVIFGIIYFPTKKK